MFRDIKLFFAILQIGGYILVNYANPVTNVNSGTKSDTFAFELPKPKLQDAQSLSFRISSLSTSGRSYGDTSIQNQATNPASSSANGRILSQPTTPDKDAITYPDDIVRDSYGNIATPYTTLVEETGSLPSPSPNPSSSIGVLTDVNKDKGQHLQFVIPSYSDGITEIQGPYKPSLTNAAVAPPLQILLPPLSSGNYNYPQLSSQQPSPDNTYQNEIGGSFSSSAQSINPVPTGPTSITTNGHIGTVNNSPSVNTPNLQVPFSSPSAVANDQQAGLNSQRQKQPISGTSSNLLPKPGFASIPNNPQVNSVAPVQGSSDFTAIHISSPELNTPSSTFPFANTKPLKDTQIVNQVPVQIQVDSGKYTGGFGGAPGILGEQKVPGYAVTSSGNRPLPTVTAPQVSNDQINSIQSNTAQSSTNHGSNTLPSVSHQPASSANQNYQGNLTPTKPHNVNQSGNFGQSNTNHGSFQFGTAISTNPTHNAQTGNNGKYTGGFGGPPGILAPFDNVKTGKNIAPENSATSTAGPRGRKY